MKANELMIADWVSVQGAGPAQVVMVDQYHIITTLAKHLVDERKLEPIKITDEILLANGFVGQPDVPEGCFNYVYNNGGQIVYVSPLPWDSFSIDANFHGRLSTSIQYVHELQHILLLIGINDLADNFKIEKGGGK